ncbi:MAG: lytic transglycosylase domain-containing protein [Rhizobacter sp.]|nr:lytic transglycosylase domain-containing protein [Bacteriovorax sp.]
MKKILIALLLLSGCSSKPSNPLPAPNYESLTAIKAQLGLGIDEVKSDSPAEVMARKYMAAMLAESAGNKKGACKLFSNLSDNESFPLNQTALVHTLSNCSYSAYELKSLWKNTVIASYLKENYLEVSLKLAEKYSIDEFTSEFSYELVAFKPSQSEKIKLLKNAIILAQKNGSPDKEEKYFQKLTEVSAMNVKEVTKENKYAVAKDFESNRQFEKSRDLYLEIINGEYNLEEKVKAYNSYRMSFKVARNLKTFLEKTGEMELYLRQLLDESPEDAKLQEAWVDAKINYARAVWTEHMNEEARAILEDVLERKIGTSTQIANIYWIYGSLHLESKENKEALAKFIKASEYKVATLDLQENIQWAVIWNKYLLKKYTELITDVDKFTKKSSNPNFVSKLNFWKAKTLLKLARDEEAKEIFKSTAASDSFGYYGILSAMETKTPLSPLPESEIIKEPIGNLILDWLIAVDEKTFAVKVLKDINSQFKTVAQRERAMSLYAQTGWYQGGMLQIYNFPIKMRDELTKKYVSVIYPTPYQDIFSRYSKKYNVPEAYPLAITRQESAFNTNIRSWADAFGLMQMIPEKASELSKKYKIPYKDYNDLYQPEINVQMGTVLLSELRSKYKGKFAQSTAAYNASSSVITVWEKERFNGDYLEFIESIPYEETRNYIKLVFRNYVTYRRILEKEEILIPQDFFANSF